MRKIACGERIGAEMRARIFIRALLAGLLISGASKVASAAPETAVFKAIFVNTSLQKQSPEEAERLNRLTEDLRQALEKSGQYHVVDLAPIKDKIADVRDLHDCNGCEIDLAREAGAQLAVVAWVQKVSNLILNINVRIEDVATGKRLKGGSVDIRDNSDISWDRGLKFLLEEHVFGDRP